jgi:outer membrane protein TolC
MKMADISLKQTEQQIGNQVKSIYYSILAMERTVNLLEQNLENLRTLHRTTQNSVDVGVAEQTDADQLSVQVATMETTISSTKRSLEMLYNSMRLQLGVAPEQRISLSQSIEELINFENALSLLSEEFVIDNNYNYQLLKENTRLSKQQVHMKEWAYGPTITAAYQYSAKKYFSDERTMNMTPPNAISISLSVPIFSSGRNFTGVKEAKLAYKKQLNTLADTEDGLNIQHSQLKYNLSSAYESFDTQKKNVEVSQRVFTNISNKYEHGLASSLDVTNSGSNLISAQSSYVQALLELVNAQIELEELLNL